MGNDSQKNEEQMEMLLMTLGEVSHGICLFQSENQMKRVLMIQERMGKEKVIIHNIADDEEEAGMVNSQDFRRWASRSDAKVVIIYNMQILGIRFGDDAVVEKLNFMRDQILAVGKLFVFGVSPYFNLLLSRNARDLYSCILYHFTFQDSEKGMGRIYDFDREELSGDDALESARYWEMKERIQNHDGKPDISMYLACIDSWCNVRDYLSNEETDFVRSLVETVERHYIGKDIEMEEVDKLWILAGAWIGLEEAEKSVPWYKEALCIVKSRLGEEHSLYADALAAYTNYFWMVQNYVEGEKVCDQAIKIYHDRNMKYSERGRAVLLRKAVVYRVQSKYDEALEIYEDLLNYQRNKYGEKYYGNAYLHNNIGRIYKAQGDLSRALAQYELAAELLKNAGKSGGELQGIYQNMCVAYLDSGNGKEAWKYIKKAKRITEDVYGTDSIYLIQIYNSMAGVWRMRARDDKELEYLQKALDLIKKTHMEESEAASYIYHNMGNCLCAGGYGKDAAAFYKHAIKIREKVYGEMNELTASSYEQLAYVLYIASKEKDAEYCADKARNIYISLYGSRNEHLERMDDFLKSLRDSTR